MGGRLAVFRRCQEAGIRLAGGKVDTRRRLIPTARRDSVAVWLYGVIARAVLTEIGLGLKTTSSRSQSSLEAFLRC